MLIAANGFVEIGRGFREAFDMFLQTFWALSAGFVLSGLLQEFVPRQRVEGSLGNHRPPAVARAARLGAVSSSCSYAAASLTRRLYQKGADLVTALAFMVASTNLVIELGIVIGVLIGWQFVIGEYAGGVVMIIAMALFGSLVLSRRTAPMHARAADDDTDGEATPDARSMLVRLSSAASYALSDLSMLKKELLGGFVAAGVLSTVVPTSLWVDLFYRGHGGVTSIENALVGPVVAFLACVCSVGNVPLAATLWHEGIGFSGIVAFLLADLLAAPLVVIYTRYYGRKLASRVVALFYAAMVLSALAVDALFSSIHLAPKNRVLIAFSTHLAFDTTTILDLGFLMVLALAVLLAQWGNVHRADDEAIDPICHMRIHKADAIVVRSGDVTYFFCSEGCAAHFSATATTSRC